MHGEEGNRCVGSSRQRVAFLARWLGGGGRCWPTFRGTVRQRFYLHRCGVAQLTHTNIWQHDTGKLIIKNISIYYSTGDKLNALHIAQLYSTSGSTTRSGTAEFSSVWAHTSPATSVSPFCTPGDRAIFSPTVSYIPSGQLPNGLLLAQTRGNFERAALQARRMASPGAHDASRACAHVAPYAGSLF
jgi:hypothetical protein